MGTIAFDSSNERPARAPISAHPAFPGIVALWFAALLGLGSLVLPPVLLERFVAATGLASLIPAFGPPLGFTARALLALAAALLGAGLGVAMARRVARGHRPEAETRAAKLAAGLKRPISVHDELGGEGVINGHGLPINRRRALAISEDERPSDFLYIAPLPGEDPYAEAVEAPEPPPPAELEPLELNDMVEEAAAPEDDEKPSMADRQEFEPVSPFARFEDAAERPAADDDLDLRKNAAGPRGLEPLPFSPPSLARRAPQPSLEVTMVLPEPEPQPRQEFAPPAEPAADEPEQALELAGEPQLEADSPSSDWETAPTESLGLVQLVQRLGRTIEKRREWVAAGAIKAAAAPAAVPLSGVEAAPAEEAAQAMAAYFGAPAAALPEPFEAAALPPSTDGEPHTAHEEDGAPFSTPQPAFLRALSAAEDDEQGDEIDELPTFDLPLGRAPAAPPAWAADDQQETGEEGDDEEEGGDDGFTSLLEMRNPFEKTQPEFVRIEEPEPEAGDTRPAVVFPAPAAPGAAFQSELAPRRFDPPGKSAPFAGTPQAASADTDAALRNALATLQRMSGAA